MKMTNQSAAVMSVAIVSVAATVVCLAVFADMDDGALIGLATAAGAILGNLLVQLRSNAKLADQDETLDRIVTQTNGLSEAERLAIARQAAAEALAQFRSGE